MKYILKFDRGHYVGILCVIEKHRNLFNNHLSVGEKI